MAKQLTKLPTFFEGKRRLCTLDDYHQLKTKAGEDRVRLSVSMPLSDELAAGIPEAFAEEYALMLRNGSSANYKKIAVEVKGALVSIFSTDVTASPSVKSHGATLTGFRLTATGGETRSVDLEFFVYIPWSQPVREWCSDVMHSDFYMETVPAQMDLTEDSKPAIVSKKKKKGEGVGSLIQ